MKSLTGRPLRGGMVHKLCLATVVLAMGSLVSSNAGAAAGGFPDYIPLDPAVGEFSEGVAVDKIGTVYISVGAGTWGAILKFAPFGKKSVLAQFTSSLSGLAVDNVGNVFAAQPGYGVVSVDKQGQVFDVPGTEQIALPNGLVFDQEIPGLPLP